MTSTVHNMMSTIDNIMSTVFNMMSTIYNMDSIYRASRHRNHVNTTILTIVNKTILSPTTLMYTKETKNK